MSSRSLLIQRKWESKYSNILRQFNFDRQEDENSAILLASIIQDKKDITPTLKDRIKDKNVIVVGAGHSLGKMLNWLAKIRRYDNTTVIAADKAAGPMVGKKIIPDITVTDLDGDKPTLFQLGANGKTMMIVHAHSDNKPRLCLASRFKLVMGTTQSTPFAIIRNFGGFTDGDRGVFLAYHFEAKNIILVGMDFEGKSVSGYFDTKSGNSIKLKKLKEAKRLLEWLAQHHYQHSSPANTGFSNIGLYSISKPPKGFIKINTEFAESLLKKKN